MDDRARAFIESATLLFIASRGADGSMDVSPRGGQPCVLRLRADGCLLLPDYVGNRRLDTLANILSNPDVALLLVNRRSHTCLRIAARASVSQADADLAAFPADENPPLSVMVLAPSHMEFFESRGFAASGFWIDPSQRKPPLDVLDIYASDMRWQAGNGHEPVLRDDASEVRLSEAGLRDHYGVPSKLVQTKVFAAAGPGFMGYIDDARFIVLAHEDAAGGIRIDLGAGSPLRPHADANRQAFLLDVLHEGSESAALPASAACAIVAVEPGRSDAIRLNGVHREVSREPGGARVLSVQPDEIYFHCSAAFARSRVWADTPPSAWTGRRAFVCTARRQESPDVVSFVLAPRDSAPVGEVLPGQYVTVSLPADDHQPPRRRCYSVSGRPERHSLRITVRRIPADGVSALLHDALQVGDELLVGQPAGHFVLDSAPARPVALVSAGVGITPLLPMLHSLAAGADGRDVWFVHAARDGSHHLFRQEVLEIAGDNPSIRLLCAYSRARPGEPCDHRGRLDAGVLAAHLPVAGCDFYICGPDPFMSSLRDGLVALGATPESIRTEAFAAGAGAPLAADMAGLGPSSVTFARSGKAATWTPQSGSLLDLALAAGVDVQYSCRSGECQSCAQRIVSGKASYPAGEEPLLARGQALLCQAVPRGDIVIDC